MLRPSTDSDQVRYGQLFTVLICLCLLVVEGCGGKNPVRPAAMVELTRTSDDDLCRKLDAAIDGAYLHRRLNLRDHAAWQIVHGILAYERDFMIADHNGKLVPALDYLLNGGEMRGWLLRPANAPDGSDRRGLLAVLDAGSTTGQGHTDQWLGYLSDCNLGTDQIIKVAGQEFTIEDMLRQAERDVGNNELREYSWTLMALTTYRKSDYRWTAGDGNPWSIGQLLDIEVNHDLEGSTCGGTHRLSGIVMALNRHKQQQGSLEGAWLKAEEKVRQCTTLAREFQNPDGSFSTNFFTGPGTSLEIKTSLHATGHTFEFLVMASDDEQVKAEWLRQAALFLCEFLESTSEVDLECGALYHAIRGLILYRERLCGARPFPRAQLLVPTP